MKRITLLTATLLVALSLTSCKGKSEKAEAQSSQSSQPEVTGMTATLLKSAEKTRAEEEAALADLPEQAEPLFKTTERRGFKMGAVISYQSALKADYTKFIRIKISRKLSK